MKKVNWIGVTLSFVLAIAVSDAGDSTILERATGSSVVQAVVDAIAERCIFPNDRLFVRRMAFVETQNGNDISTFRSGFYGGIWQITKSKYEATRLCQGTLQKLCTEIKNQFQIDWQQTSWKDLLKPFYSGLAAYLSLALHNQVVPGDPVEQEKIWMSVFHTKTFSHSRNFPQVAQKLSASCNSIADIAFLVDDSGSIDKSDFDKMKEFLVNVTLRLPIGDENIRISLVRFDSSTQVVSYLNQDKNQLEVIASINSVLYTGMSTDTAAGIHTVTNDVFSMANGAKKAKDAPRVLVLITDGQSDSRSDTVAAAELAKSNNIDIISVGVGSGINYDELNQVASKCNKVYTLNNYDDFENFINELIRETCEAKAQVSDNGNKTTVIHFPVDNDKDGGICVGCNSNSNTPNNTDGHTIVVETTCVVVKVYGSYDNQNPSESMFQVTGIASDGRPVILFVKTDDQGRPLYLKFKAIKHNSTANVCFNNSNSGFDVKVNNGKPKVGEVVCEENGTVRNCTSVDLVGSKWRDRICPHDSDISTIGINPCTPERLRAREFVFPYPNDENKFLKCNMKGRAYVISCPEGQVYKPGRDSCEDDYNIPQNKKPLIGNNPCTYENMSQNRTYFAYPKDHEYYIHCDEWGSAWVVACPDDNLWFQNKLKCAPSSINVKSPCTKKAISNGHLFFPYPNDKRKYIQCDKDGGFIIQECGNLVYNELIGSCI